MAQEGTGLYGKLAENLNTELLLNLYTLPENLLSAGKQVYHIIDHLAEDILMKMPESDIGAAVKNTIDGIRAFYFTKDSSEFGHEEQSDDPAARDTYKLLLGFALFALH